MIRKIHGDEFDRLLFINRICFAAGASMDWWFDDFRAQKDDIINGIWGCYEDGEMVACLREAPYTLSYDGGRIKSAGISCVATMPEARNRGNIKRMFSTLFEHLAGSGYTLSTLYPFSHPYYARLGYANCCRSMIHEMPFGQLEPYAKYSCDTRMHFMKDGLEQLNSLHSKYVARYNLGIHRSGEQWLMLLGGEKEAERGNNFRYIFYDKDQPVAYVLYRVEDTQEHSRNLEVYDFAYTSPGSLRCLLGFLYSLRAQHKRIIMDAPLDFDIYSLVDEPYEITSRHEPHGMARILDVESALGKMQHPQQQGGYSIEVVDEFFPANSGVYAVEFAEGEARVARGGGDADMACDINTLTQLAVGYLSFAQAALKRSVEVNGNEGTLAKVFVNKPVFMNDQF